jgi:hypothetical protein
VTSAISSLICPQCASKYGLVNYSVISSKCTSFKGRNAYDLRVQDEGRTTSLQLNVRRSFRRYWKSDFNSQPLALTESDQLLVLRENTTVYLVKNLTSGWTHYNQPSLKELMYSTLEFYGIFVILLILFKFNFYFLFLLPFGFFGIYKYFHYKVKRKASALSSVHREIQLRLKCIYQASSILDKIDRKYHVIDLARSNNQAAIELYNATHTSTNNLDILSRLDCQLKICIESLNDLSEQCRNLTMKIWAEVLVLELEGFLSTNSTSFFWEEYREIQAKLDNFLSQVSENNMSIIEMGLSPSLDNEGGYEVN